MLIFIDIETSALHAGHHREESGFVYYGELLEVAVIRDDGKEYVWRMDPEKATLHHPRAKEINGYHLRIKNYIVQPWRNHIQRIHDVLCVPGALYVGHNVQFDLHWLNYWFEKASLPPIPIRGVDTMTLAHEHLTPCGLYGLSFDKIRKFLGWERRDYHDALNDCRDVRRLYQTLTRATLFDRLIWGMRGLCTFRF